MKLQHKSLIFSLALLVALMFVPGVAHAANSTSDEVATAKAKLNELYDKAAQASESLNATNVLIDQTNAQISALDSQIQDDQQQISQKQAELDANKEALAQVVQADYKQNGTSLLSVLLEATSFDDLVSRVYYMNKMSAQKADTINAAIAIQNDLQSKSDELSTARSNLETQRAQQQQLASQQASQKSELNAQVSSTQSYLNSLSTEVRKKAIEPEPSQPVPDTTYAPSGGSSSSSTSSGGSSSGGGSSSDTSGGGSGGGGGSTPSSATRSTVMASAKTMIGGTYVYGACDPVNRQFDCSGFTMWCFSTAGISLPHNNIAQMGYVSNLKTNMSDWEPGDLIFWPAHVAVYMGNGMMIDAGTPATGVSYRAVYGGYYGAGWPQ